MWYDNATQCVQEIEISTAPGSAALRVAWTSALGRIDNGRDRLVRPLLPRCSWALDPSLPFATVCFGPGRSTMNLDVGGGIHTG